MHYSITDIGSRIRQLRKAQGMTQEQLATRLNIVDRHMRRIEAGEKSPSLEILVEITNLFGVSLDYIVLGKQSQADLKSIIHETIKSLSEFEAKL